MKLYLTQILTSTLVDKMEYSNPPEHCPSDVYSIHISVVLVHNFGSVGSCTQGEQGVG